MLSLLSLISSQRLLREESQFSLTNPKTKNGGGRAFKRLATAFF